MEINEALEVLIAIAEADIEEAKSKPLERRNLRGIRLVEQAITTVQEFKA